MNYSVFEVFRIGIGPSSSHSLDADDRRPCGSLAATCSRSTKRLRSAGWRSSIARGWRSTRWSGDGGTMRM